MIEYCISASPFSAAIGFRRMYHAVSRRGMILLIKGSACFFPLLLSVCFLCLMLQIESHLCYCSLSSLGKSHCPVQS